MALSEAEINKLRREGNKIKSEALKILDDEVKRSGKLAEEVKKNNAAYKEKIKLLREVNQQIQESRNTNRDQIDALMKQEQALKGLTGIQASFVDSERKRLKYSQKGLDMYPTTEAKLSSIASLNQDLLGLSAEDEISRAEIIRQIESQMASMKNLGKDASALLAIEKDKFETAKGISSLTEGEQEQLEAQLSAYRGIKKSIGGVLDTASALSKTLGGIVGSLIVGMGYVTEALGKTTREMGGFVGGLTGATTQVTILGTIFPQALDSAKGLSSEFGGLNDLSFQTQLNTNLMATNMGISGQEAAALTGNFARLNGGSIQTAQNLAESTKQLAKANGLMPSQVMADVAGSAQAFAEYGIQGGINIGEAAVAAGKLGVNMSTLTGVTDNLLDFESSITKELELGAMLGKNINLNKARQLAYEGQIGASVKEALNQMGGIEAFNRMDIFQKRQAAAALGLSTDQLQKMAGNMDKLNDDGTMQLSTFDSMSESLTAFATGPMGSTLKGLGSAVIATGQMNMGLNSFGTSIGGMVKGLGRGLKHLVMYPIHLAKAAAIKVGGMMGIGDGVVGSYGTKAADSLADKAKDSIADKAQDSISAPDVDKSTGDKLKSLAGGLKEMGNAKVLFGALNLIPTGLGFLAVLPGLPGMFGVGALGTKAGTGLMNLGIGLGFMGNGTVTAGAGNLALAGLAFTLMTAGILGLGAIALLGAPAAAGLTALAGGLVALGNPAVAGFAAIGVAILGGLSLAMMGVGYALGLAAPFVEAVGSVITSVFQGIATVIPVATASIISLMDSITLEKISGIALLSLAFMGLAASLYLVGSAGLFALPALLGIAAASVGLAVVAELFGLGSSSSDESSESTALEEGSLSGYESQMIENMKKLITATSAPKDFIIDGQKFGRYITKNQKRDTTNNYALK